MLPRLQIVMGVSGCGKSTVAKGLADAIDGTYLDGDDFHPQDNIDKMSQGIPLNDEDRFPWLRLFASVMTQQSGKVIGACSSLTKSYRECLTEAAGEPILFIYLDGSKELILERMSLRKNHFMPSSQLDDQFNTLEIPDESELTLHVDISGSNEKVLSSLLTKIETFSMEATKKLPSST